jgi:TPR repeat protein
VANALFSLELALFPQSTPSLDSLPLLPLAATDSLVADRVSGFMLPPDKRLSEPSINAALLLSLAEAPLIDGAKHSDGTKHSDGSKHSDDITNPHNYAVLYSKWLVYRLCLSPPSNAAGDVSTSALVATLDDFDEISMQPHYARRHAKALADAFGVDTPLQARIKKHARDHADRAQKLAPPAERQSPPDAPTGYERFFPRPNQPDPSEPSGLLNPLLLESLLSQSSLLIPSPESPHRPAPKSFSSLPESFSSSAAHQVDPTLPPDTNNNPDHVIKLHLLALQSPPTLTSYLAQLALGHLYIHGYTVVGSCSTAYHYYHAAAAFALDDLNANPGFNFEATADYKLSNLKPPSLGAANAANADPLDLPPGDHSSESMPFKADTRRTERNARLQTPTKTFKSSFASEKQKGSSKDSKDVHDEKVQGIVHHLTLPPAISPINPGPILDTLAYETRTGIEVEGGLLEYYRGKCDTGSWRFMGQANKNKKKTPKRAPDADTIAVVQACWQYAENESDNELKAEYMDIACQGDKMEACGRLGYGLLMSNLHKDPEERSKKDVERALELARLSTGPVEQTYDNVFKRHFSGNPSLAQLRGREFWQYHFGCGKSNRYKSVKEVKAHPNGILDLPDGIVDGSDKMCNDYGMVALGLAYLFGFGDVQPDYVLARMLIEIAADDGNVEAMYYVGRLHLGWFSQPGQTELNEEAAIGAFQVAATSGSNVRALYYLSELQFKNKLKTPQTSENCLNAVNGLKFVAEKSPLLTQYKRQVVFDYKDGNYNRAMSYSTILAELGLGMFQYNSGWMAENGICLDLANPEDCHALSLRYYKAAAMQGHGDAWVKSGDLLYSGAVDVEEEGWLSRKLTMVAKAMAQTILSFVKNKKPEDEVTPPQAELSLGVNRPPTAAEIAAEHYKKAAQMQIPQAYFNLGYLYHTGVGLEQDFPLAKRYYDHASSLSAEAKVAVELALLWLHAEEKWSKWKDWFAGKEVLKTSSVAKTPSVTPAEAKSAKKEAKARGVPITTDELKAATRKTPKAEPATSRKTPKEEPVKASPKKRSKSKTKVRSARSYLEVISKHAVMDKEAYLLLVCGAVYLIFHKYRQYVFYYMERNWREQQDALAEGAEAPPPPPPPPQQHQQ